MDEGVVKQTRDASQRVAITAAAIAAVSAMASGTLGLQHAKDLYDAAQPGAAASFGDFIAVGNAFADAIPLASFAMFPAWLLRRYGRIPPAYFYAGPIIMAAGALLGSLFSPQHLQAFNAAVLGDPKSTQGHLQLYYEIYGELASILALIAGAGAGWATAAFITPAEPA